MGEANTFDATEEIHDVGHRLPGEEESEQSPLLDDAQHWQQVYAELISFKRNLLDATGDDQPILATELRRLEDRHRYWQERTRQLTGR
jgi:hypothetical protein